MKKTILAFAMVLALAPTLVLAKESTIYYTTTKGYELTKEEYENLRTVYDEEEINYLGNDILEVIKNKDLISETKNKYFKTEYTYDNSGNIIRAYEKEISEEEWTNNQITARTVVTKNYDQRKLSMKVKGSQTDHIFTIDLDNEWTTIPKIKSYDIIGIRPLKDVALINSTVSAIQYYNSEQINYDVFNGSNSKVDKTYSLSEFEYILKGIGVSMNLVDAATYGLRNRLYIAVKVLVPLTNNPNILHVAGAYEHAIADVSLSDSKSYEFSPLGLGGIFNYSNNTIKNKYEKYDGIFMQVNAD